jgi:hypothetical protein
MRLSRQHSLTFGAALIGCCPSMLWLLPQAQRTILKGVLTRLSGSTGFQLINVSNAPIVLKGRAWPNLLVNKVSDVMYAVYLLCSIRPACPLAMT